MWSVASGAGAYSHGTPRAVSPQVAGAGWVSGFLVSVMTAGLWHRRPRYPALRCLHGTRSAALEAGLGRQGALEAQQKALAVKAARVAAQSAVGVKDAVAWNDDRDRVGSERVACGSSCPR